MIEVRCGELKNYTISPEDFGLNRVTEEEVSGLGADGTAKLLRQIFSGHADPRSALIALNAGAGLYISGNVSSIHEGVVAAQEAISDGRALNVLEEVAFCTKSLKEI